MISETRKALVDGMISLARKKGYRDSTIRILIMLCHAKNLQGLGISTDEAYRKVIGYIKESPNPETCLSKASEMAGYDPDAEGVEYDEADYNDEDEED